MAGLGAAAGAFEGDTTREEAALRRAQLDSQNAANAARLNLQGYQFDASRRDAAAARAEARVVTDQERAAATARDQRNFDNANQRLDLQRTDSLSKDAEQKRQFDLTNSRADQQESRFQKQVSWDEVLKDADLQEKQQRIKTNRLQFEELDKASKKESEQIQNRQQLAKTGLGALALAAMKNGGIASPAAIELFNKQQAQAGTGIKVSGGVWSADGFAFKRRGPGQDQNGQPIETDYDEVLSPAIAQALFKDEFGEDVAKEQSSSQHESARYANAHSLAKNKVLPEDRLLKLSNAAKAMMDAGMEVPEELNAQIKAFSGGNGKAEDPVAPEAPRLAYERARLTKIAKQTGKPVEAYVAAGMKRFAPQSTSTVTPSAGSDSFDPEVINEARRIKRIADTKPKNEQAAYYQNEMKKFMDSRSTR